MSSDQIWCLCFFLITGGGIFFFSRIEDRCMRTAKIVNIGGCGRENCGVILDNGEKWTSRNPVIGEVVCLQREFFWRKK